MFKDKSTPDSTGRTRRGLVFGNILFSNPLQKTRNVELGRLNLESN
jgi:hypothetical protein